MLENLISNVENWQSFNFEILVMKIANIYFALGKQATGYASQHIWCLSQTRIIGLRQEGHAHKNGGIMEVGR